MTDTPEEPTASTPATEPVAEVESETAADFSPPVAEDAAPGTETRGTATPVDTVTRKSAALAMAACLLVGGAIGWLGAAAFGDDDDALPISAFGEGRGGERGEGRGGFPGGGRGPGGGFPEGGFPEGGLPEGGFPGGPMGPGGGFPGGQGEGWGDGDHPVPPWADGSEDGDRGQDDGDQDDGDQDDGDQDDGDQGDRGDDETPSSTTGS